MYEERVRAPVKFTGVTEVDGSQSSLIMVKYTPSFLGIYLL